MRASAVTARPHNDQAVEATLSSLAASSLTATDPNTAIAQLFRPRDCSDLGLDCLPGKGAAARRSEQSAPIPVWSRG
jgi:hypothetical protein